MAVDGRRIAILGGGKIGESLLAGLLSSGWRKPEEIVVTGRRQERVDELAELYGVETTLANADAVSGASFIVIAVKPQDFDVLLGEVGGLITPEQTVLSVAAAVPDRADRAAPVRRRARPARDAEHACHRPRGRRRALRRRTCERRPPRDGRRGAEPRRPSRPDCGAVHGRSHGRLGLGTGVLRATRRGDDRGRILLGLSREVSTQLVIQTMFGTAKLLRDEEMHPVELREMVTSPGGTTIRAIRELERAGVRAAFLNAIQAAMERSKELAEGDVLTDDPRLRDRRTRPQTAAAELLVAAARAGEHLALSGGDAPGPAFEHAAELEPNWSAARLWWGDERCVPPDDERSNYLLAKRSLLDRLEQQPSEVHRIRGELGGEAAAAEYDDELEGVRLGLALQGIGPDGHTASLFPSSPALEERERRAIATPHEDVERVTMTLPVLSGADAGRLPRAR